MDLLIVTALTEEQQVVIAVLNEMATYIGQGKNHIGHYQFERRDGTNCRIGVCCAHQMGATKMGAFIAPLLKELNPSLAVLVGIAAAVDQETAHLGDVPFSSHVLSYDDIAVENGEMTFRTEGYQTDPEMRKAVGDLLSSHFTYSPWRNACIDIMPKVVEVLNELRQQEIKPPPRQYVKRPHLLVEVTAGGPFLIRDGEFRDSLKEMPKATKIQVNAPLHPKLVSVEMESHGFMNAAHEQGVRACVLKGICDDGDKDKRRLEKESGGYYRAFACSNAVQAVLHILQITPDIKKMSKSISNSRENDNENTDSQSFQGLAIAHAYEVLEKNKRKIYAYPGVVADGIKAAIVVCVEEGYNTKLPDEIDGVSIVVRKIPRIQVASGSIDQWPAKVNQILIGDRSGGLGTIVVAPKGSRLMITANHVLQLGLDTYQEINVMFEGNRVPAQLLESDYSADIALLKVDTPIIEESIVSLGHTVEAIKPILGQEVSIGLPDRVVTGVISTIEGSVSLHPGIGEGDELVYVDGVFMIQTRESIALGQSGALVTTLSGTPLGLVVGMIRSKEDHSTVFAVSIKDFLRKRNLKVELSREPIVVGILVTNDSQIHHIFEHCEEPVRHTGASGVYWRSRIIGFPNISVVLVQPFERGGISSAISAMELIKGFSPDVVLGVGLAIGTGIETQLGDVVISDSVISITPGHEIGKLLKVRRSAVYPTEVVASQIAELNIVETDAERPDGRSEKSRVHIGAVVSTENLYTGRTVNFAGVLALEMEGAGISTAAEQSGVPYLLVRGISEHLRERKNDDDWRDYASSAAVSTAIAIIQTIGSAHKLSTTDG